MDTFQCAHCQYIVHIKPRAPLDELGGRCGVCDGLICPACVNTGRCDPFEEKLKRAEHRAAVRRSYAGALAFLALLLLLTPASAAFVFPEDISCETSTDTGNADIDLAGALTNYLPFATTVGNGNSTTYSIVASDGKVETGLMAFTDGTPDTITRTAAWSTDGVGAELTLPAGTHQVCTTLTNDLFTNFIAVLGVLSIDIGAADTSVTRGAAGEIDVENKRIKHAGTQTIPLLAGAGTIPSGGGTAGCTAVSSFDSGSNDIFMKQCSFNAATINAIYWTIPFPKSAAETTFTFSVDWTSATGTDTTDDVIWVGAAVCFGNDDSINANAFSGGVQVTDTQTAAGDILRSTESSAITPSGSWAEGDVCVFRLHRFASNGGDNFNGTAEAVAVNIKYSDNASSDD